MVQIVEFLLQKETKEATSFWQAASRCGFLEASSPHALQDALGRKQPCASTWYANGSTGLRQAFAHG